MGTVRSSVRCIIVCILLSGQLIAQNRLGGLLLQERPDGSVAFLSKGNGILLHEAKLGEAALLNEHVGKFFEKGQWYLVTDEEGLRSKIGYSDIRGYAQGMAAFRREGKWGYLDEYGKEHISPEYLIAFDFTPQGAVVFDGKVWSVVDKAGYPESKSHPGLQYIQSKLNGAQLYDFSQQHAVVDPDFSYKDPGSGSDLPNSANAIDGGCPANIGFESGSFNGWSAFTGYTNCISGLNRNDYVASAPTYFRHSLLRASGNAVLDPYGFFPINPPDSSRFFVLLGNDVNGAQTEKLRYIIQVPSDVPNFSITYNYAVVFQDPSHERCEQPRFSAKLFDPATNTYLPCGTYEHISDATIPGFYNSPLDEDIKVKPWSEAFINLSAYAGKTLYLEFSNSDCTKGGHWGYSYLDVNNICNLTADVNYQCIPPHKTTLTGPSGFKSYKWWSNDFTATFGNDRQLSMDPGMAIGSKIWVEVFPFSGMGCRDTLPVTIVPVLPNANFNAPFPQCLSGNNFLLDSRSSSRKVPIVEHLWSLGDGSNKVGRNVEHSYATSGNMNINLIVVDQNGCRDTATGSVTIHPEPVAGIYSNASTLFCDGDSIVLTSVSRPAAGGGAITQFQWFTNDLPIPAAEFPSLSVYNTGRFLLKVTDENQCSDTSETVTTIAQPLPQGRLPMLPDPVICEGARTMLTVQSNASSFQWYRNGVVLPAERGVSLEVREEGIYTVEMISVNGCKSMADGASFIQMRKKPIPDFTYPVHCKGIPIPFSNTTDTILSGSVNWYWDFGDGEFSDREHPVHIYSRGTAYAVKLKATPLQCPSLAVVATKTVVVEEPLPGIRYKPMNAVAKTPTPLQSRTFGNEYLWFPSTGLSNPQSTRPQFTYDQPIEYTIRIRTDAGCTTYDTLLVRMFKQYDIMVPNAFSPNGDGHNDRLDVFLIGIRELRFFRVFNRWGQLLFDTKDPYQLWDGTFRGVKQPLETYVWIAEGISEQGESIIRRGQTLLLR